jgi:predicted heme/steroid binding protein
MAQERPNHWADRFDRPTDPERAGYPEQGVSGRLNGTAGSGSSGSSGSRVFTSQELSRYDGKEGRPAYVAYRGLVFDVSKSLRWKDGRHQGLHEAGRDLSAEFKAAPHGTTILLRVPIVGRLKRES